MRIPLPLIYLSTKSGTGSEIKKALVNAGRRRTSSLGPDWSINVAAACYRYASEATMSIRYKVKQIIVGHCRH